MLLAPVFLPRPHLCYLPAAKSVLTAGKRPRHGARTTALECVHTTASWQSTEANSCDGGDRKDEAGLGLTAPGQTAPYINQDLEVKVNETQQANRQFY